MATRREELLEATIDYLLVNGVSDLSLRPLAAAIGTKARLLIYHFGSRNALITAALTTALRRVQQSFVTMRKGVPPERAVLDFWKFATSKRNAPYLELLFEVHGLATHHPDLFGEYVQESLDSWRAILAESFRHRGATKREREERASVWIGVFDGLLLDYLATGDLKRTKRALVRFTKRGAQ